MEVARTILRRPVLRGADSQILLRTVERAIERREIHGRVVDPLAQQGIDPPDLSLAGQKHQNRAGIGPKSAGDDIGDLLVDPPVGIAPDIPRLDRIGAAFAIAPPEHRPAGAKPVRHRGSPT